MINSQRAYGSYTAWWLAREGRIDAVQALLDAVPVPDPRRRRGTPPVQGETPSAVDGSRGQSARRMTVMVRSTWLSTTTTTESTAAAVIFCAS